MTITMLCFLCYVVYFCLSCMWSFLQYNVNSSGDWINWYFLPQLENMYMYRKPIPVSSTNISTRRPVFLDILSLIVLYGNKDVLAMWLNFHVIHRMLLVFFKCVRICLPFLQTSKAAAKKTGQNSAKPSTSKSKVIIPVNKYVYRP